MPCIFQRLAIRYRVAGLLGCDRGSLLFCQVSSILFPASPLPFLPHLGGPPCLALWCVPCFGSLRPGVVGVIHFRTCAALRPAYRSQSSAGFSLYACFSLPPCLFLFWSAGAHFLWRRLSSCLDCALPGFFWFLALLPLSLPFTSSRLQPADY